MTKPTPGRTWGAPLPSGPSPLVVTKLWCGGCVLKLVSGGRRVFLVVARAEEEEKDWRGPEGYHCLLLHSMFLLCMLLCTLFCTLFARFFLLFLSNEKPETSFLNCFIRFDADEKREVRARHEVPLHL